MGAMLRTASAMALVVLLAACTRSGQKFDDLRDYMEEVRARPAPPIEPLPEFKSYQAFAYGAATMRSPFERPVDVKQVRPQGDPDLKPDTDRVKEYLEQFPIGDLKMVGTLERNGNIWALVRDPEGSVHRVSQGDFMGMNHGEIQSISEQQIELEEIVSDGAGGWLKRARTVRLASQQG